MTTIHRVELASHWDDSVGIFCSCGALVWVFVGFESPTGHHTLTLDEVTAWAADHGVRPANTTSWRDSEDGEWQRP